MLDLEAPVIHTLYQLYSSSFLSHEQSRSWASSKGRTYQNSPQLKNSISQHRKLPVIAQTNSHPIPLPHPPLPQPICQDIAPLVQLPVCQSLLLTPRDYGCAVAVGGDDRGEMLGDCVGEEGWLQIGESLAEKEILGKGGRSTDVGPLA
jgi:hypothetical protein